MAKRGIGAVLILFALALPFAPFDFWTMIVPMSIFSLGIGLLAAAS